MLIGEVSQVSGVTVKALRYYESAGLIDAPDRTAGGYRDYPSAVLGRLQFIRAAQAVDLSLGEIKEILAFREQGLPPCAHVLEVIERRAAEIDDRIAELTKVRSDLRTLARRAKTLDRVNCPPSTVCHFIVAAP
ncbi:MAG: hypoxia response transcriptional regulator [Acidimicrobiales bacterium]